MREGSDDSPSAEHSISHLEAQLKLGEEVSILGRHHHEGRIVESKIKNRGSGDFGVNALSGELAGAGEKTEVHAGDESDCHYKLLEVAKGAIALDCVQAVVSLGRGEGAHGERDASEGVVGRGEGELASAFRSGGGVDEADRVLHGGGGELTGAY